MPTHPTDLLLACTEKLLKSAIEKTFISLKRELLLNPAWPAQ